MANSEAAEGRGWKRFSKNMATQIIFLNIKNDLSSYDRGCLGCLVGGGRRKTPAFFIEYCGRKAPTE
jgi:hypothetical protein